MLFFYNNLTNHVYKDDSYPEISCIIGFTWVKAE